MGPMLLCDKSAIQSLNAAWPFYLHHYFSIVVPPILVKEILGDLSKIGHSADPERAVAALAQKVTEGNNVYRNMDFRELISEEFDGEPIRGRGRPMMPRGKRVQTADGKTGIIMKDDDLYERLLLRWRTKQFAEIEPQISKVWRTHKEGLNWRTFKNGLEGCYGEKLRRQKSLEDTMDFVDDLLRLFPWKLLIWFCHRFGIPLMEKSPKTGTTVSMLPYTFFCIRTALFSYWAMEFELVSQKQDNELDLEYLFYLPFCGIFIAHDKFPNALCPFLLKPDQAQADYTKFAHDLEEIATWMNSLSAEERQKAMLDRRPPAVGSSIIKPLWDQFISEEVRNDTSSSSSIDFLEGFPKGHAVIRNSRMALCSVPENLSEVDFVIKHASILGTDPCPCESGVPYLDCCGRIHKTTG